MEGQKSQINSVPQQATTTTSTTVSKKANPMAMFRVDTTTDHESIKVSKPEINVFWGQNEKLVKIDVLVQLPHDKVDVSCTPSTLKFNFPEFYEMEIQLANPIVKEFLVYKVLSNKVEIKLKKDMHRTSKRNMTWASLCKDGSVLERGRVDDQLEVQETTALKSSDGTSTTKSSITSAPLKITHDWYQTEKMVIVEVRVKGLLEKEVSVTFENRSLSVNAKLPYSTSREYNLELDLSNEIDPEQSTYKVLPAKLEIKMEKKKGIRWTALEQEVSSKQDTEKSAEDINDQEGAVEKPKEVSKKDVYKYWDSQGAQRFMDTEIWQAYRESVDKKNDMRSRDKFVQDSIQDYIGMHNSCPPGVNPRDIWGGNIPPRYY